MKRLLGLLLLAGIIYGGYNYYQLSRSVPTDLSAPTSSSNNVVFVNTTDKIDHLASVLGASINNTFAQGQEFLSNATSGKSEPIINELVSKTSETLKDLPRKEAERIKYEFCRGVIEEYENISTQ